MYQCRLTNNVYGVQGVYDTHGSSWKYEREMVVEVSDEDKNIRNGVNYRSGRW